MIVGEETEEFVQSEVRHKFQRAPEERPGHTTHTNTYFPNLLLWKDRARHYYISVDKTTLVLTLDSPITNINETSEVL